MKAVRHMLKVFDFYMEMYAYICVRESESVCFGLLSHYDGVHFHVEVSPGWLGVSLSEPQRFSHVLIWLHVTV